MGKICSWRFFGFTAFVPELRKSGRYVLGGDLEIITSSDADIGTP